MIQKYSAILGFLLLATNSAATASTYQLFDPNDSLIGDFPGEVTYTTARDDDTLLDIARRFDIGQDEIVLANPDVDRWLPKGGTRVRLPTTHIVPATPREGLTLNLPELRLYYFESSGAGGSKIVKTHPIGIGRQDWRTPVGTTRIISKTKDPTWTPPESIKAEHAAKGDPLPDVVPAGPDNPLGRYAMKLGIPGYLIHSTNRPFGVGMRVSHGCVRMYPEDIERLFSEIRPGSPVHIVDQPVKVGWLDNKLYIEVHPPLEEMPMSYERMLDVALDLIAKANGGDMPTLDGYTLRQALHEQNGMPVAIAEK